MNNAVIHVGLPRTGTLFVQSEILSKSEDIFYVGRPYTQEGLAFNMIQYCDDTLYDQGVVQSEIDSLKRRADGRKIVISDEQLVGNPWLGFRNRSSIARRLQQYFPTAEIVLCLRNQVDIVASLFRKYTEIGEYQNVLDERFIRKAGKGLSFEAWKNEADWDVSRRFVSHRSVMSVEYFKYTALYELYRDLFDKVTVLLFEDLREKRNCFFNVWERIAQVEANKIRSRAKKKVNESKYNYAKKVISNRTSSLLDDTEIRAKKAIKKVVERLVEPFINDKIISKEYVKKIMEDSGIPKDNRKLIHQEIANLDVHKSDYLLE